MDEREKKFSLPLEALSSSRCIRDIPRIPFLLGPANVLLYYFSVPGTEVLPLPADIRRRSDPFKEEEIKENRSQKGNTA